MTKFNSVVTYALFFNLLPAIAADKDADSLAPEVDLAKQQTTADNKHSDEKSQNRSHEFSIAFRPMPQSPTYNQCAKRSFTNALDQQTGSDLQPFRLSAAQASSGSPQQVELKGNVRLDNGALQLQSEAFTLNRETSQFEARQAVNLETDSALFSADSVRGNTDSKDAELKQTQFQLKQTGANGKAAAINLIGDDASLTMTELSFSTCPAGDNSWRFYAGHLSVDQQSGWGEAEDLVLRIANVPVFYFPWLRFPVDNRRHTGILPPSTRIDGRNGFEYSQPIYWNIAPNYDATFTPRYLEQRGTQLGVEFRYLGQQHAGESQVEWLDDRAFAESSTDSDASQRWAYATRHTSQFAEHWQLNIDAAGVSDRDYFHDLGSGLSASNRSHLTRYGELGYYSPRLTTTVGWLQFQPLSLTATPYRQLPQANLYWQALPADSKWYANLTLQQSRFRNDDPTLIEADRSLARTQIGYSYTRPWGYVKPEVSYHYARYQQDNIDPALFSPDVTVAVPSYSLDSQLVFQRPTKFGTQTLEPRLFLLRVPYEQQTEVGLYDTRLPEFGFEQLFRNNRFSGFDRVGDTQQASLALTSRLLDADDGTESFRLSLGQSFYADNRRVRLDNSAPELTANKSNLVSEISWHPNNALHIRAAIGFNQQTRDTEQGHTSVIFEPDDNFMVNVSHRFKDFTDSEQEQSDIALFVPLGDRWRMMARWNYDLINRRSLETMAGLEYESCCWSLRLVTRRYLSARLDANGVIIAGQNDLFNDDLLFEFEFKGISGGQQSGLRKQLEDSRWSSY